MLENKEFLGKTPPHHVISFYKVLPLFFLLIREKIREIRKTLTTTKQYNY